MILTPATRSGWNFSAEAQLSVLDVRELANTTAYCWTVETAYHGPTATRSSYISVSFVGSRKGSRKYSYRHALSTTENHVAAAVSWMQQLSSLNGAPSYTLLTKASTDKGFVFTFC
jgi:hypothetical protein